MRGGWAGQRYEQDCRAAQRKKPTLICDCIYTPHVWGAVPPPSIVSAGCSTASPDRTPRSRGCSARASACARSRGYLPSPGTRSRSLPRPGLIADLERRFSRPARRSAQESTKASWSRRRPRGTRPSDSAKRVPICRVCAGTQPVLPRESSWLLDVSGHTVEAVLSPGTSLACPYVNVSPVHSAGRQWASAARRR